MTEAFAAPPLERPTPTSHPAYSRLTRGIDRPMRMARILPDVLPINRATMATVNLGMGLPMVALARRARVQVWTIGDVRADIVTDRSVVRPTRTILHIHGGAFVFGNTRTHRQLAAEMSRAANARVILFDYRLAPRAAISRSLADCLTVYRWTAERFPDEPLAVSGDSAGGNLMVSLLAKAAEHGLRIPEAGIGMSAWLDPDHVHPKGAPRDPLLSIRFADRASRISRPAELIRPLRQALPQVPILLQCGADEPIRAGNEELVRLVAEAGGQAELHVWERQPHCFQTLAPFLPEAVDALRQVDGFLTELGH